MHNGTLHMYIACWHIVYACWHTTSTHLHVVCAYIMFACCVCMLVCCACMMTYCACLAWHIYTHTAFKHTLFALHCLLVSIIQFWTLSINTSGASCASVYVRTRMHMFAHWGLMITIAMCNLRTKDSSTKNSYKKRQCFQGVSTTFWIILCMR